MSPAMDFQRVYTDLRRDVDADERSREEWVRMCNKMHVTEEEIEATLPAPPLSERGFGT